MHMSSEVFPFGLHVVLFINIQIFLTIIVGIVKKALLYYAINNLIKSNSI